MGCSLNTSTQHNNFTPNPRISLDFQLIQQDLINAKLLKFEWNVQQTTTEINILSELQQMSHKLCELLELEVDTYFPLIWRLQYFEQYLKKQNDQDETQKKLQDLIQKLRHRSQIRQQSMLVQLKQEIANFILAFSDLPIDIKNILNQISEFYDHPDEYGEEVCALTIPIVGCFVRKNMWQNSPLFQHSLQNSGLILNKIEEQNVCEIQKQVLLYIVQKYLYPEIVQYPSLVLRCASLNKNKIEYYQVKFDENQFQNQYKELTNLSRVELSGIDQISFYQSFLASTATYALELKRAPNYLLNLDSRKITRVYGSFRNREQEPDTNIADKQNAKMNPLYQLKGLVFATELDGETLSLIFSSASQSFLQRYFDALQVISQQFFDFGQESDFEVYKFEEFQEVFKFLKDLEQRVQSIAALECGLDAGKKYFLSDFLDLQTRNRVLAYQEYDKEVLWEVDGTLILQQEPVYKSTYVQWYACREALCAWIRNINLKDSTNLKTKALLYEFCAINWAFSLRAEQIEQQQQIYAFHETWRRFKTVSRIFQFKRDEKIQSSDCMLWLANALDTPQQTLENQNESQNVQQTSTINSDFDDFWLSLSTTQQSNDDLLVGTLRHGARALSHSVWSQFLEVLTPANYARQLYCLKSNLFIDERYTKAFCTSQKFSKGSSFFQADQRELQERIFFVRYVSAEEKDELNTALLYDFFAKNLFGQDAAALMQLPFEYFSVGKQIFRVCMARGKDDLTNLLKLQQNDDSNQQLIFNQDIFQKQVLLNILLGATNIQPKSVLCVTQKKQQQPLMSYYTLSHHSEIQLFKYLQQPKDFFLLLPQMQLDIPQFDLQNLTYQNVKNLFQDKIIELMKISREFLAQTQDLNLAVVDSESKTKELSSWQSVEVCSQFPENFARHFLQRIMSLHRFFSSQSEKKTMLNLYQFLDPAGYAYLKSINQSSILSASDKMFQNLQIQKLYEFQLLINLNQYTDQDSNKYINHISVFQSIKYWYNRLPRSVTKNLLQNCNTLQDYLFFFSHQEHHPLPAKIETEINGLNTIIKNFQQQIHTNRQFLNKENSNNLNQFSLLFSNRPISLLLSALRHEQTSTEVREKLIILSFKNSQQAFKTNDLLQVLALLPNLQHLCLAQNQLLIILAQQTDNNTNQLAFLELKNLITIDLNNCHNLTTIRINAVKLQNLFLDGCIKLQSFIVQSVQLQRISSQNCPSLWPECLAYNLINGSIALYDKDTSDGFFYSQNQEGSSTQPQLLQNQLSLQEIFWKLFSLAETQLQRVYPVFEASISANQLQQEKTLSQSVILNNKSIQLIDKLHTCRKQLFEILLSNAKFEKIEAVSQNHNASTCKASLRALRDALQQKSKYSQKYFVVCLNLTNALQDLQALQIIKQIISLLQSSLPLDIVLNHNKDQRIVLSSHLLQEVFQGILCCASGIRRLDLSNITFSTSICEVIKEFVQDKNFRVKQIALSNCAIRDEELGNLVVALKKSKYLRYLDLSRNQITEKSLKDHLEPFLTGRRRMGLNLSNCSLANLNNLQSLKDLRLLQIRGNNFKFEEIQAIARFIKFSAPKIEIVDLRDQAIDEASVRELCFAVEASKSLINLQINQNQEQSQYSEGTQKIIEKTFKKYRANVDKSKRDTFDYKNVVLTLEGVGDRAYFPITILRYLLNQTAPQYKSQLSSVFDVVSAHSLNLVIALAMLQLDSQGSPLLESEDSLQLLTSLLASQESQISVIEQTFKNLNYTQNSNTLLLDVPEGLNIQNILREKKIFENRYTDLWADFDTLQAHHPISMDKKIPVILLQLFHIFLPHKNHFLKLASEYVQKSPEDCVVISLGSRVEPQSLQSGICCNTSDLLYERLWDTVSSSAWHKSVNYIDKSSHFVACPLLSHQKLSNLYLQNKEEELKIEYYRSLAQKEAVLSFSKEEKMFENRSLVDWLIENTARKRDYYF